MYVNKSLQIKVIKAYYYACISVIDYKIGRIISAKEKALYDKILVIYTYDHREMSGDYNCFGKRIMLDSACRIPLIVKGNNFNGNTSCINPVSLADIFPAILAYAGIDYSNLYTEGEDLYMAANEGFPVNMFIRNFRQEITLYINLY